MERYSKWRDPSTGLAPFNPPVPPAGDESPLVSVFMPVTFVLAILRTVVFITLAVLELVLVEGLASSLSLAVPGFRYVTRALRAILVRLQLLVLGFAWIPVEVQASKRGRASVGGAGAISSSVQPPVPGDLIVCNWSSPIDVLYLSFRFNAIFLLPVQGPDSRIVGFHPSSSLAAFLQCGKSPSKNAQGALKLREALDEAIRKGRVAVLFPEYTTSNNRAVLRLGGLDDFHFAASSAKGQARQFVYFLKHDPPSSFRRSATAPVPPSLPLLTFPFVLSLSPLLRSLHVRTHPTAEAPPLPTAGKSVAGGSAVVEGWSERLLGLGKVKRTGGIGWEEKQGYLDYAAKRS